MKEEIVYDAVNNEYTEKHILDHVPIRLIQHKFKEPLVVKPDEGLRIIYQGDKLISTQVIKESDMPNSETEIIMSVISKSMLTPGIQSSGSKVFLLQEGHILAGEFLGQIEQLITDILGHYSVHKEWPDVMLMPPDNSESDN